MNEKNENEINNGNGWNDNNNELNNSLVKNESGQACERNLVAFPCQDGKYITIIDIDKHKDNSSFWKVSNQSDAVANLDFN